MSIRSLGRHLRSHCRGDPGGPHRRHRAPSGPGSLCPPGQEGSEAVQGQLGLSSMFWAAQLLMQMPLPSVKSINAHLIKRVAKRSAAKGGALALGRLLPFGIGAAIGWKGGRALANQVIEGAQAALGPARSERLRRQLPRRGDRSVSGIGSASEPSPSAAQYPALAQMGLVPRQASTSPTRTSWLMS